MNQDKGCCEKCRPTTTESPDYDGSRIPITLLSCIDSSCPCHHTPVEGWRDSVEASLRMICNHYLHKEMATNVTSAKDNQALWSEEMERLMWKIEQLILLAEARGREEERKEIAERIEHDCDAIIAADKTPKYEYSRNQRDANARGKFTEEAGKRWAMPREIAEGLLRFIRSRITNPQEK